MDVPCGGAESHVLFANRVRTRKIINHAWASVRGLEKRRGSGGGGGGEELVVSDDRTREGTLRISNARMTDEGKAPGTRLWRTDNQE